MALYDMEINGQQEKGWNGRERKKNQWTKTTQVTRLRNLQSRNRQWEGTTVGRLLKLISQFPWPPSCPMRRQGCSGELGMQRTSHRSKAENHVTLKPREFGQAFSAKTSHPPIFLFPFRASLGRRLITHSRQPRQPIGHHF